MASFILETRGYVCSENPKWGKTHFTTTYDSEEEALKAMKVATKNNNNVFARVYTKDDTIREWYYGQCFRVVSPYGLWIMDDINKCIHT